jgi:hypothetical protein
MKYTPAPPYTSSIPRTNRPPSQVRSDRAPLRVWKKEDLTRVLFALVPGCGERSDHYANGPPPLFIAVGGHVCSVPNGGQCHKIRRDIDRSISAERTVPHPRCDQGRAPLRMWMKGGPRPGVSRSRILGAGKGVTIPRTAPRHCSSQWGAMSVQCQTGGNAIRSDGTLTGLFLQIIYYSPLPPTQPLSPERTAPHPRCDQSRAPVHMWTKGRPRPGAERSRSGMRGKE